MIKNMINNLKKPNLKLLSKDFGTNSFKNFDFKAFIEKQKKLFNEFIGKNEDTGNHLSNMIEEMIKNKYNLKGGFGDLIANEQKYEDFVRTLGYEYYESYNELLKVYTDTSFQLDEKKLEFCTSMYIITLEDKKNKNKVLGIRDVVNLDFEWCSLAGAVRMAQPAQAAAPVCHHRRHHLPGAAGQVGRLPAHRVAAGAGRGRPDAARHTRCAGQAGRQPRAPAGLKWC